MGQRSFLFFNTAMLKITILFYYNFCRGFNMKIYEINSLKKFNFSCIYLWTNMINNKKYIGQAHVFYNRMIQYRHGYFNSHMKSAIEKYGIENFDITILEKASLLIN